MADPELAALRAARLHQLQQSETDANSQSGGARSEEAEKRRAEEQMRRDLLATALEPAARERRMCILLSFPSLSNSLTRCRDEWHIYSVPHCARVTHEIKSDRVYPPADGTNWTASGTRQRATAH